MKKTTFLEFYPYYLQQHQHPTCRKLHVLGTGLVLLALMAMGFTGHVAYFWVLPLLGYIPAWVGHFYFEKNKPATFDQPIYSLMGDLKMFADVLMGRLK